MSAPELHDRLGRLGTAGGPPTAATPVLELRARARRRRARRTVGLAGVTTAGVVLALVAGLAVRSDRGSGVIAGPVATSTGPAGPLTSAPPPSTSGSTSPTGGTTIVTPPPQQRALGDVAGVSLRVEPSIELVDGSTVRLVLRGVDRLHGLAPPILAICRGDVTAADVVSACDGDAVEVADLAEPIPPTVRDGMEVVVRRVLDLGNGGPDPADRVPYDCATAPAGCVFAMGLLTEQPVAAVVVPVRFRPQPLAAPAAIELARSTDLADGEVVQVRGRGALPGTVVEAHVCGAAAPDPEMTHACDLAWSAADTDRGRAEVAADGTFSTSIRLWAAIYDGQRGVVDCTREACRVVVFDQGSAPLTGAEAPFRFAAGVVAPVPTLTIDEPPPYRDDQTVMVRGAGFRPGATDSAPIGQCPAHLDTAREERCGRGTGIVTVTVGADGTFTVPFNLRRRTGALLFDCSAPASCHLGWVLHHGTTIAKLPLTFAS